MNSTQADSRKKSSGPRVHGSLFRTAALASVIFSIPACGVPARAQSITIGSARLWRPQALAEFSVAPARQNTQLFSSQPGGQQVTAPQSAPSISGIVVDASGAAVAGAKVTLAIEGQTSQQQTVSGGDGYFSFLNLAPGNFHITVSAPGFTMQTSSGTLQAGEKLVVAPITLTLATAITQVQVVAPREEIAEAEVKAEEKQRVLGFVPNFYVAYSADAEPLTPKQKFELAWKTSIDPFTILVSGGIAGVQQAQNHIPEYGQGAEGYGKRFGAAYGNTVIGTFIGSAILPSILKQDPRYFYKGTGSTRSRILYAMANAVITRGDNKKWQPNYSGILGNLAVSGIANAYYPAQDRDSGELLIENLFIGIGTSAAANLFQEFIVRKLTPSLPHRNPAKT